ncbi:MAG TPA: hypothetical protein VIJ01_18190 [Candidatus Angelobacter sp.]
MGRYPATALGAIFFCLILSFLASCGGGGGAEIGAGQALALAGALEAVKPGLDESVNNAGNQANQTLRNAQTRADYLIKHLNDLAKQTGGEVATQREQAAGQAFTLLGELYTETQRARMNISVSMFQGLAAAAAILDSIPFIHVPDTPFAALPIAFKPNASDRRVIIYGYFPSLKRGEATIRFDGGTKAKGMRGIGSLFFDVPNNIVKEGSFVNASVSLPSGSIFSKDDTFGTRVYVLPQKPFHVNVDFLQRNDGAYRDIAGTAQAVRADSDHQSVHWIQNAGALFMTTVPTHADYDPNDVVFKDVQLVQKGNDKPCDCCPSPSFVVHAKTLDQVDIELGAPNCGHCGSLFNLCGGGGSHIDISATPIFTARLIHESKTIPLNHKTMDLAENDVAKIPFDPKAVMTQIVIEVSDGQSSAKDFAEISNRTVNQSAATAAGRRTWDVSLAADGTIVITTKNLPVTFVGQ